MRAYKSKPLIARGRSVLLVIFALHLSPGAALAQQVLDRIVAVVGNQIILQSELDIQFDLYTDQMGITPRTDKERSELKKQLLERMINDRLLLIAAQQDTTIEVTAKEVDQAVDGQLAKVKSEFSEEEFEAQLQAEGLTESELRKKYREQMKNQMMIDRLVSFRLSKVSVSTREVKDFYQTYKDSIPDQPEAVKLSHILLEITPSQSTLDSLKSRAGRILKQAKNGKDFAQLAASYSDDPTAKEGGNLGFFRHGDMIPRFEEVAFALEPGEISDIVETEFGYHIIKVEEKEGDQVRARHILFLVGPSRSDTMRVQEVADSLYRQLLEGAEFAQLTKEFSADEESKKMGGELGWYPVEQMTPEFKEGVSTLEIGEISPPLESEFGVHILKVLDKK
ncbi:MAG: hypothetical protein GTO24_18405, partial [candidate division Zixibacteria bacterium]|nr:hypothetical protein [candidate division Zixibacteria bacterium]